MRVSLGRDPRRHGRRLRFCIVALGASALVLATLGGSGASSAGAVAQIVAAPAPRSVTGGGAHFCSLTAAGGVKCWSYNLDGELGDGTTVDRLTPVDVSGLTTGVAGISAGGQSTCAVTATGGAKCWGNGHQGQLGNGSYDSSTTPVDVTGLTSGVASISAGYYHACAVTTAGGVKCWGDNEHGSLGNGTRTPSATPVDVTGLASGVAAVATGLDHSLHGHSCALTTTGGVKCWGDNGFGELGDGTTIDRLTPVDVAGLGSGVAQVFAGGTSTCAVTTGGLVKCWGHNDVGQLGDGTTTDRRTPVDVAGLGTVSTMAMSQSSADEDIGGSHTCAVTTAGSVRCWGENRDGQIGDGSKGGHRSTQTDVSGLGAGMVGVGVDFWGGCAVSTAGAMRCWGSSVGDGTTANRLAPVDVSGSFYRTECPTLIAAPNTTFTLDDGYAVSSVATFTPAAGYVLVGSPTSTCRSDATWTTPVPTATAAGAPARVDGAGRIAGRLGTSIIDIDVARRSNGELRGSFRFTSRHPRLAFSSSRLRTLDAVGGVALVTGDGSVHGCSGYRFIVIVVDNGHDPRNPDRIAFEVRDARNHLRFTTGGFQPLRRGDIGVHASS